MRPDSSPEEGYACYTQQPPSQLLSYLRSVKVVKPAQLTNSQREVRARYHLRASHQARYPNLDLGAIKSVDDIVKATDGRSVMHPSYSNKPSRARCAVLCQCCQLMERSMDTQDILHVTPAFCMRRSWPGNTGSLADIYKPAAAPCSSSPCSKRLASLACSSTRCTSSSHHL